MRKYLALFIMAAAIAPAGCVKYHAEPLSAQESSAAYSGRTLSDPGLREFIGECLRGEVEPWPPASWDFTLLTLAGFYYSPELDVARAQWQAAEAGKKSAAGRPNPTLDYKLNIEAVLSVPIETAGKRGHRMDEARALAEASQYDVQAAAWRVRSRVRASLLALYSAEERVPLLQEQYEAEGRMAALLERRSLAGEVAREEAVRARILRDQAGQALAGAQTRTGEAKAELAAAIGVPASALDNIELSFDLFQDPPGELSLSTIKKDALQNRPDLLAALAEYEAAEAALQLEIAKQYPDVRLGPAYEWQPGANEWTVGISITLPVLNQNQGGIAEAEAKRQEAATRFRALQAEVVAELDRALAAYRGSLTELKAADAVASAHSDQSGSAAARFAAGETDRLELVGARAELLAAQASRLDALVSAQAALGRLEDAAQYSLAPRQPWPEDLTRNPRDKEDQK